MEKNFERSLLNVLVHEGGFVNHPSDPGGATNKGITIATFRKWVKRDGTVEDLKALTKEQAAKVYRAQYWNAVQADELPSGIDYAVFDIAVNSGPSRAIRILQEAVGATIDGKIGPATIAAAQKADPIHTINVITAIRMDFLRSLRTWDTFGKGWSRRVSDVRENALQLTPNVKQAPIPIPPKPVPVPEKPSIWAVLIAFILSLFRRKAKP
jgi:lysozyme family protein